MTTLTLIRGGITVPSTFTWDNNNIPLQNTPQTLALATTAIIQVLSGINQSLSGTTYIQGFAPAVSVLFNNLSIDLAGFEYNEYIWDFGDYYNTTNNNVSLSCNRAVSHIYIMPGLYTVSLKHIQAKNASTLYGTINKSLSCFGKYNSFWNWYDLSLSGNNPFTWEQTKTGGVFQKKWVNWEANNVIATNSKRTLSSLDIIAVQEQTGPQLTVEVVEIPPKANMYSITPVTTGISPLLVHLSPRKIIPGSFPIDRIDWDFGDKTPVKVVTRYNTPDLTFFAFTCAISSDPFDPRNYDAVYTYTRDFKTYPIFYPSLTAYSSSTGTFDTCSLTIGPISLTSASNDVHLLKVRNIQGNNLYALQVKNYTTFVVSTSTNSSQTGTKYNIPSNPIKNSQYLNIINSGYNGTGFPQLSSFVSCP